MQNEKFLAAAREFRELKDEKEANEKRQTEINKRLTELTVDVLPALMDENEIEKITIDGVGTIYQQVKIFANVKKENEARFHEWLAENGHANLIRAYVFPATLNAFAKEQLELGTDLPDFLSAHKVPTAMLRRT